MPLHFLSWHMMLGRATRAGLDALSELLASWCRFGMGSPGLVWVMCALKPCLKANFWVEIMAQQVSCWNFSGSGFVGWWGMILIYSDPQIMWFSSRSRLRGTCFIFSWRLYSHCEVIVTGGNSHIFETTMISNPNNFIQHSQPTRAKFGCLQWVFSFSWWDGWLHFCCKLLHRYEI